MPDFTDAFDKMATSSGGRQRQLKISLLDLFTSPVTRAVAFVLSTSGAAVRLACFCLNMVIWPTFSARIAAEMVASVFLVDLVSGIVHVCLDFSNPGEDLGRIIPRSKEEVHNIRQTQLYYRAASSWRQIVWDFQVHHAAPFPEHDNQWAEVALLVTPALALTWLQYYLGHLAQDALRVWTMLLCLGYFVQSSHFLSHQRVHDGEESLPPLVKVLQDAGLLLHPAVHKRHHETYDCNFCIFNGWANVVLNPLFLLALRLRFVDPKATLGGSDPHLLGFRSHKKRQ